METPMAIIDTFLFNGELDLLEIRLNILNDYVDQFVIVEAPTTFMMKPKELYYENNKERFAKWHSKIKYHVIDEDYSAEEYDMAYGSSNTEGQEHWKHEFLQKESTQKALIGLNDDDICFVGDCDEIWNPLILEKAITIPAKLSQIVYTYFLNNQSNEQWAGTFVSKYKMLKNKGSINQFRQELPNRIENGGWHFTNMGGEAFIRRKLESYGHQEFNTDFVKSMITTQIAKNLDYVGRAFIFTKDESSLPQYLLDNKDKYKHLWKL